MKTPTAYTALFPFGGAGPGALGIAEEMLITLSSADQDSFQLSASPVWVGPQWRPETREEARP